MGALINLGITETLLEQNADTTFERALEVAADNPLLEAKVLLNLGWMYERRKQFGRAEEVYRRAVETNKVAGDIGTAARLLNNLGVLFQKTRPEKQGLELSMSKHLIWLERQVTSAF